MLPMDSIPASDASMWAWSAEGRSGRSAAAAAGRAAAGEESSAAVAASSEVPEVDRRQHIYWELPLREETDRGRACDLPPASRSLPRLQSHTHLSCFRIRII